MYRRVMLAFSMAERVTLIANARAGRGTFEEVCGELVALLQSRGHEVVVARTTAERGSATQLAAEAAKQSQLVIACGGDGTVHEVLQSVAGTSCALGVLAFGTANALARNLRLPLHPVRALERLLTYAAVEIPLGEVTTASSTRLFTVMAGAGPDGGLALAVSAESKLRYGRHAYYATAARHLLTRRFPRFRVEYRERDADAWVTREATAMMVSRVPSLGGSFRALTRASRLHHPFLRLQLVSAPAQLALTAWFASTHLRLEQWNPLHLAVMVAECRCTPIEPFPEVLAQMDGEGIGTLPVQVRVASRTVRLLMPPGVVSLP